MEKIFQTIKVHKCSVKNCTNLVKHKDSFCQECLDKLSNNYYVMNFCFYCEEFLGISHTDIRGQCIHELIEYDCCDECRERHIDLDYDSDMDDF